ncbi:hypothetical protein PGO42_03100 [Klebsiella aerogenes]
MVHPRLLEIDNLLSTPAYFAFLSDLILDDVLDLRDSPIFDSRWMAEFNRFFSLPVNKNDLIFIHELREKAFKFAFRELPNSELAARISDDIELVARSLVAEYRDTWAETCLWSVYLRGEFPCSV